MGDGTGLSLDQSGEPKAAYVACANKLPLQPPELDPEKNPNYVSQWNDYVQCLRGRGMKIHSLPDGSGWTYDDGVADPAGGLRVPPWTAAERECTMEIFGARSNPTDDPGRRTTRRKAIVVAAVTAGGRRRCRRRRAGSAASPRRRRCERPPPVTTTTVTRADLSDSRSLNGTLGFGPERMVKGAGEGVVTRLPKVGDTVARGKPLYWVNDRPVPVLFGGTPLFRTLDKPRSGGQRRTDRVGQPEGAGLPHRFAAVPGHRRHEDRHGSGAAHRKPRRRDQEVAAGASAWTPPALSGSGRSRC